MKIIKTNSSKITIDIIKQRLIDAIKYSGIKQKDLAMQIGVKETMISEYIHTKKMPSLETFAKICSVLDIDANFLLGIID